MWLASGCHHPGLSVVTVVRTDAPRDRFVVEQIGGVITRRITCATGPGREPAKGQDFGMIEFGSRTELYVPAGENIEPPVRVGDKAKAGITPLARYRQCHD